MAALIWKWACTTHTVWLVIFARYLFLRFSWVKSHLRKLKPRKFCCPRVKRTNRVSIPGLLLYSSLQKRVSECAFDGYHWSNPKCYVNTDARSRQRCKAESRSNHRGSQIHRSRKLKPRKFSEIEILSISRKFVPAKITNHTVFCNLREIQNQNWEALRISVLFCLCLGPEQ